MKGRRENSPREAPLHQQSAKLAREALGASQRKFGQLLGVRQSTVWRWEAGERDPGVLGEALFELIVDDPARAERILQRLRCERERSPAESQPQTTKKRRRRTVAKSTVGFQGALPLGTNALTTAQLHELMDQAATAIGSRDPAKVWRRLRRKLKSQALNFEEFKLLLPWSSR